LKEEESGRRELLVPIKLAPTRKVSFRE